MEMIHIDLSSSNSVDVSPSRTQKNQQFTTTSIEHLLKRKDSRKEFIIIENNQKKATSAAWSTFGFPARLIEDGTYNRIPGFASCFQCKSTYTFQSDGSGSTKHLLRHICPKVPSTSDTYHEGPMIKLLKSKRTTWICSSIRSFNIIQDVELQIVLQTVVDIGKLDSIHVH
jgi:hypothetical protein